MTKDEANQRIYCHVCKTWVKARPCMVIGDSVYCQFHWHPYEAHLGYVWDWKELFENKVVQQEEEA